MNKSTLVTICQGMTKNAPNGLRADVLAGIVGKEYPALMSELSQQPGHKLGAEIMLQLMKASDGRAPIHFMAQELGGVFVELPPCAIPAHGLTRGLVECVKEFGEFMTQVASALEDGSVTQGELHRISRDGQEALTAILKVMELARMSQRD